MYKQGVILELRKREAVVFNNAGEYEKIKRLKGMTVGQVVEYDKAINVQANRLLKVISVAAVLIAVLFSYSIFKASKEEVFAYVTLDIDTSMEFSINKANDVLGIRSINQEAEEITKLIEVKGKKINAVVSDVMDKMEKLGYIDSDKSTVVLLSTPANASLDKDDKRNAQIDKTMASIKDTVKNFTNNNTYVEVIPSTIEARNQSIEADMSLGRYVLYTKALEQGVPISLQDAKTAPLSQLVKKAEIHQDDSDTADSTTNRPDALSKANKPALNNNISKDKLGIDNSEISRPIIDRAELDRPKIDRPADKPVADKPVIDKPVGDKPVIDKPVGDKPIIDKPVTDKPEIDKLEIHKPEKDRPEIDKPEIHKPEKDRPEIDKPEINKPEMDRPEMNRPEMTKPEIDKPEIDKPEMTKPEIDKPEINRPEMDRPEIDKPKMNKPEMVKPALDKPIADKPGTGEIGIDKPHNKGDAKPAPVVTIAKVDDDKRRHLAKPAVPRRTPSANEPLHIKER